MENRALVVYNRHESRRRRRIPAVSCLQSKNLDDHIFDVEAMAADTERDERKLLGPRLVRRLSGNFWSSRSPRAPCG